MPARRIAEVLQLTRAVIRMELHRHPDGLIGAFFYDLAVVAERLFDLGLGESQGVCGLLGEYTPWVGPPRDTAQPTGRIERTPHRDHRGSYLRLRDSSLPDERLVQRVERRAMSRELAAPPTGEQQGRTRVSAKKAILFKDPLLAEWPTVACDTFWIDQVISAAVGCRDASARLDSHGG